MNTAAAMYWSSSKMRTSSWRSVQSSGSESTICWNVSARAMAGTVAGLCEAERLRQQEHVEQRDEAGDDRRGDRRDPAVDERAHDIAAPREQHQRHERERDAEAQHDLADDQRARGVQAERQHDQRWRHGHEPAQDQRDLAIDEALHDDLARVRADA